MMNTTAAHATTTTTSCDPAARVTRSLLGYGIIAGPIYVLVSVGQGLTRDGFDFTRHAWSMLANGDLGWLQMTNLVATGLMTVAFAVGLRRHLGPGGWAARLVGMYGVSQIAAGVFRADPGLGFPAGTSDGPAAVSWHGTLHFVAGGIGFACLIAACFVIGRWFAAAGRRDWAVFSRITGVVFLAGFAGIASGSPSLVLAFTAAVLLVCTWIAVLALHLYKAVR